MANFDLSNNRLSVSACAEKLHAYSELAIIGKSSRGRVANEKLDLPATTSNRFAVASSVSSTIAPSGNLRTISCKVCAPTVVAPARSTIPTTLYTTSISKSVARNEISPPSASIKTFAKIGIVLRRSTTD